METQTHGNDLTTSEGRSVGIERRKSPREECNVQTMILVNNREIKAELRNISTGGAFLSVEKEDNAQISSTDVGKKATFRLVNGKFHVNFKGTIGRYTETEEHKKYMAIIFRHRSLLVSI